MTKLLTTVLLLTTIVGLTTAQHCREVAQALDRVLEQVRDQRSDQEAIEIDFKGFKYEKRLAFVVMSYEVALRNIRLTGVYDNLRRQGDVQVISVPDGSTVLRTSLIVGPLQFTSDGVVEVLGFSGKYDWNGRVTYVRMPVTLHFDPIADTLQIRHFVVSELYGVEVTLEGRGTISLINKIRSYIVNYAVSQFQSALKSPIQAAIEDELKTQLAGASLMKKAIGEVIKKREG